MQDEEKVRNKGGELLLEPNCVQDHLIVCLTVCFPVHLPSQHRLQIVPRKLPSTKELLRRDGRQKVKL